MSIGRAVARPSGQVSNKKNVRKSTPHWLNPFPSIYKLLMETQLMKGERLTPTITLSFHNKKMIATLNDRSRQRSLFVTCDSPRDAFDKLDSALDTENPDWRQYRSYGS